MQRRPRERGEGRARRGAARGRRARAAVERVARHRVADRGHVDADLVRAAGVDGDAHERRPVEALEHAPAGAGRARPLGLDRHALAPHRVAPDRRRRSRPRRGTGCRARAPGTPSRRCAPRTGARARGASRRPWPRPAGPRCRGRGGARSRAAARRRRRRGRARARAARSRACRPARPRRDGRRARRACRRPRARRLRGRRRSGMSCGCGSAAAAAGTRTSACWPALHARRRARGLAVEPHVARGDQRLQPGAGQRGQPPREPGVEPEPASSGPATSSWASATGRRAVRPRARAWVALDAAGKSAATPSSSTIAMICEVESVPPNQEPAVGVAAQELEPEAHRGVERHVGERDLAVEALARQQPEQEREDQERRERLVELARVQRRVHRRADLASGVHVGEGDGPRQLRGLAPAAAGGEAAEPPDRLAEHDARRERVGGRASPASWCRRAYHHATEDAADQAAVEDAAALEDATRARAGCGGSSCSRRARAGPWRRSGPRSAPRRPCR